MPESSHSSPNRLNTWLPLLMSLIMVIGMVIGAKLSRSMDVGHHGRQEIVLHKGQPSTLEEILRFIDARYVDDVDEEEISQELIEQLLGKLDPHSNYLSPESVQRVNEDLDGSFNGIGIEFMVLQDTITVITPMLGGPSDAAGILAGDKIIKVADSLVAGIEMAQEEIVQLIRGERGSSVDLSVKRDGIANLLNISVTRDAIPIQSLDVVYEIAPQVLFVKLNRFSATTYREFMEGIEQYIDETKSYQLILDLRNNPGGFLNQAVDILSQLFKEKDRLLVYTEGSNSNRIEYNSTGRNFFDIESVAILVDEGSASASEIMAGAIQDWDRGYVIGRRTFGKGLVQEQYPLINGGALRLTVARYFTPAGRCIQRDYSEGEEAYYDTMNERYEINYSGASDSLAWADSTEYTTESGRIVYGGGGVEPDYHVAKDTSLYQAGYAELLSYINEFGFKYYRSQLSTFEKMDSLDFYNDYQVSRDIVDELIAFAKERGAQRTESLSSTSLDLITRRLKARLALLQYGDKGWYQIMNPHDEMINKALQLVKEKVPIALDD